MPENLLTVAALRTTVEAELIRGKLEAAGITAALAEPGQQPDGAPAGRIQVQVGPADFEKAMQLLFPIPQRAAPPKADKPPWQCPNCGEQVLGQFPRCWKCGTGRDGSPPPAVAGPVTLSASTTPSSGPAPPFPPLPQPPLVAPSPAASPPPTMPRFPAPPRLEPSQPVAESDLTIPPIAPTTTEVHKSATNGKSQGKGAPMPPARVARTAEEEGLNIVVPAWDGAAAKTKSDRAGSKRSPTDADDRAARRAWWAAVAGIPIPPLLIYSMIVVLILGLTNRPLSARGTRFFYGALFVNAAVIGAAFVWLGMHR